MYRVLVNLCLIALHIGSLVEASPVDGELIFDSSRDIIEYEMPSSCKGKSFCFDKGVHYPESTFEELLDQMPESLDARIANPVGYDDKGNSDCPANTTFINEPIYYILDENNEVRVVAQSSKFQQIYSVKWCQHLGRITEDTPHFLKGSRTLLKNRIECVNQYMDADFLVLSFDKDKLQLVKVKGGIPVCCRCRYSKISAH